MTERIYPSAKPANPPMGTNGAAAAFPATKAQVYGATRPTYRPQAPKPSSPRRSRRGCCCSCFLWIVVVLVALIFLAAIAGAIFYILYRPHRPTFTVSSLRLSALNVTSSSLLTSRLDLSVTARNPNKKLVFLYDPITITASSDGVDVGDGSFPAFVHEKKNTTVLKTTVTSSAQSLDATTASGLKKKSSLPLEIRLETRAGVKVGGLKTKRIQIRVTCDGVSVAVSKGKGLPSASSPDTACTVKLRIKIWKWYI